jgi:hypothetical protein
MAGRGQVSWLPGIGRPHLPGSSVSPPVADANAPAASFAPVTVAGPRRFHTGLPLTTDRIYMGESTRRRVSQPAAQTCCDSIAHFSILRAMRGPKRPSVAACFQKSRARFQTRLAWARSSPSQRGRRPLARPRHDASATRKAARCLEQVRAGAGFPWRIGPLRSCAAESATLQTMNRDSTATAAVAGIGLALGATAFAALTGTGTTGLYAFAFLGLLALGILLMWPERTRFLTMRSRTTRSHDRNPA